MKLNYLFTFILVIIFSNLSFAQFENGELSLGGGLGFQNSKSASTHYDPYYSYGYVIRDTTNIFRISPSLLIFAGKKISFGIGFSYSKQNTRYGETGNNFSGIYTEQTFTFNFNMRAYKVWEEKFAAFLEFGLNVGSIIGKEAYKTYYYNSYQNNTLSNSSSMFEAGVYPGILYSLSNHFAMDFKYGFLGYFNIEENSNGSYSSNLDDKSKGFGINFDTNTFNLGFRYFF